MPSKKNGFPVLGANSRISGGGCGLRSTRNDTVDAQDEKHDRDRRLSAAHFSAVINPPVIHEASTDTLTHSPHGQDAVSLRTKQRITRGPAEPHPSRCNLPGSTFLALRALSSLTRSADNLAKVRVLTRGKSSKQKGPRR